MTFKRRIIVIHKNFLDRAKHPPLLTGQTGYPFFDFAHGCEAAGKERFFFRGEIINRDAFNDVIRTLAVDLWNRAREFAVANPALAADAPAVSAAGLGNPGTPSRNPLPKAAPRNGRTIFLAKAGPGFEPAYQRLAKELDQQGFDIRPRRDEDVPAGDAATDFIDGALAQSEMSVHLIGTETGSEGALTQLQLARAAQRADATTATGAFRRVVWAPKVVQVGGGSETAATQLRTIERDPLKTLISIDKYLPSDKVDGGAINDFVIFLLQNLDNADGVTGETETDESSSELSDCYIYHDRKDSALARRVAKALQRRGVDTLLPSRDGDDSTLHRQRLQECDAVVLCWGDAPDNWARSYSHQLRDWKQLGRARQFKVRGLVVGPPPDEVKEDIEFWPKREIDVVIPVSAPDGPSAENLAGLGIGTAD